ncbi:MULTISPECIES: DUF4328 domain-containing protein [Streptosporangium]|uniref:Catechol 2,3-dioxygenase-like lactoylglutathione lyase family enzyme n=1 Tax=Streptosporangium brasiliense TaxID=47480 RepID=A0ABT9R4X6_9ACTN|nr:DUF4328 domain-containing protein [Streptosporangium brasiliense]MDP9864284.1 catechol 2,3-dioxygenase-like lactoylglutathione lyase family enzyme [Streptosporangium brasiliense]
MNPSAFSVPVRPLRPIRALATVAVTLVASVSVLSAGVSVAQLLYGSLTRILFGGDWPLFGGWMWQAVHGWQILRALLYLPAGIAFVCWLFRARANAYAISPGVLHVYAAPYLVLGWILPVVNLFVPKGLLDDIWATSQPGGLRPGSDLFRIRRPGLIWAWWLTWLLSAATDGVSVGLAYSEADGLKTAALAAGVVLPIVAGLLAIRVVLTITDLQETARAGRRPVPAPPSEGVRGLGGGGRATYLGRVALVVRDYEEAVAFYVGVLGFELVEDTAQDDGGRRVAVRPRGSRETALLLVRAGTAGQEDRAGGGVGLSLHTDDFAGDYERMLSEGVTFEEAPRRGPHGTVAAFRDPYGNRWELFQPGADTSPTYGWATPM